MKPLLMITTLIILLFLFFQSYTVISSKKTETQAYKVVRTEKDFEIRYYPAVTMATILSAEKSYKSLGNQGFRKLAAYIFGGNEEKQKIAMTTPVHMAVNDSSATMSFVMPATLNTSNLPKPQNDEILLQTKPEEYVAAIRFGGFASEKDIKKYSEKLENALKSASIQLVGHFRVLGYNPPYQLFGRRNEIIVTVDLDNPNL
jgi:hypothetical protein